MTGLSPVSQPPKAERRVYRIRGSVQGVGFRPFVFGLAQELGLTGWVLNDGEGVLIEAQGTLLDDFDLALTQRPPVLSRIDHIEAANTNLIAHEASFEIRHSAQTAVMTDIPADAATCPDCLAEMRDPEDRRFGYAFINCTHCGPRYTITKSIPYDRPQTSMADFDMCPACAAEYHDPQDRRFHAQPTCCPDCGPQLSLPIKEVTQHILDGKIIALKGLGGFHLVCDAHNVGAIIRLRQRKNREAKPFAVMVQNTRDIQTFAKMDSAEEHLLESIERPIVLLEKKGDLFPKEIAPGLNRIGVMLPYTPLHHLLLDKLNGHPLVMTSANPGGEPLVIDNQEAQDRLKTIADVIVDHNRDILIRADDSVVRSDMGKTTMIRRARGFTPRPILLQDDGPSVLSLGAYLKNTICATRGAHAYLSQHIGDLDNVATISFVEESIEHLCKTLRIKPELIIHDLHPDFATTRMAQKIDAPTFAVQHHHAHIASVLAEHQLDGPVIGVALDGFGLGIDNGSWGGELLQVNGLTFERIGHLHPLAQPGGDKAAQEPWRMGASALHQLGRSDEIETRFQTPDAKTLRLMLDKNLNSPLTSSAGRLFDAACGLLDICPKSDFEGQAPMMLESMVSKIETTQNGWQIDDNILNFLPLLDIISHLSAQSGANLFHGTMISGLADWVEQACQTHNIQTVALSGGCFLNQILSQGLTRKLQQRGIRPYLNQHAPRNDGGLSLGQAWLGRHYLQRGS